MPPKDAPAKKKKKTKEELEEERRQAEEAARLAEEGAVPRAMSRTRMHIHAHQLGWASQGPITYAG